MEEFEKRFKGFWDSIEARLFDKKNRITAKQFILKEKALSEKKGRRKENRYIIDMVLSIATSWVTIKDDIADVLNYDNFVNDVEQLRDNLEKEE